MNVPMFVVTRTAEAVGGMITGAAGDRVWVVALAG
jgi:hypothetical protein